MYRLYLDEVGSDSATRLHEDKHRYLSLTGVAMRIDHARDYLTPALNRIKADILNADPDMPICFHRVDIVNARGPFEPLRSKDVRENFNDRILEIISDCEYRVFTVVIDKLIAETKTHWKNSHPYHFIMEIMIERYTLFLERMINIGDLMPEARGNKQDQALTAEFIRCRANGTRFVSREKIQQFIPSRNLKFRTKKDNISGLQLCDLIAHPSHYCIRHNKKHSVHLGPFGEKVAAILVNQKYDRSLAGGVWGYGAKFVP